MQKTDLIDENEIFEMIANISHQASIQMPAEDKKAYAAIFTPPELTKQMAAITDYNGGKLGDKGAGGAILGATVMARYLLQNNQRPAFISAHEIQPSLQNVLRDVYTRLSNLAVRTQTPFDYSIQGDFTSLADKTLSSLHGDYSNVIINPPYQKLPRKHPVNDIIEKKLNFRLPNYYSLFILLSLHCLQPGGSLTALVPRSFFNGMYHRPFRKYLKTIASIDVITRYRSRSNLFKLENVLMENVIVKLTKGKQKENIKIFTCKCPNSKPDVSMQLSAKLLLENQNDIFVLPADHEELNAFMRVQRHPLSLSALNITFSTGKVVAYRHRDDITYANNGAMYIEAKGLDTEYELFTPKEVKRGHGNSIKVSELSEKHLVDAQNMIFIKRISSNSDKKRMHCTLFLESQSKTARVGIANSLQVLSGQGIQNNEKAIKILKYLRSDDVELAMRAINGTTQINSMDMQLINFPVL